MERSNSCDHGFGPCIAPDTFCPHWMGIFCELDSAYDKVRKCMDEIDQCVKEHPEALERVAQKYTSQFVNVKDIALGDEAILREEK